MPRQLVVIPGEHTTVVQQRVKLFLHDRVDQRTLPGSGRSGDTDELLQRNRDVNVLQVIVPRAANLQDFATYGATLIGNRNLPSTAQIRTGQ